MDSKEELLDRLQCELEAMRERAEMAKHLATSSPTHDGFLVEHAANIERATVSLEAIIKDIRNAWKDSKTSEAEMPQPRHAFEIVNTNSPNPAYRKSKIA